MIRDIKEVQDQLESQFLADQDSVDRAAMELYRQSPRLAEKYLTDYCCQQAVEVIDRWKKLGQFLIWKYLDGNVKDEHGKVTHPGYPPSWYQRIIAENPDFFRMQEADQ
jgi:hypothetical protein